MNQPQSDLRQARRVFDAGVLACGIAIDGNEAERDLRYAALAFRRAIEYAPEMADAWLGLLATGESESEVVVHLHSRRDAIGSEQRRLGLDPGTLHGRVSTGMYVDHPVSTAAEACAAFACQMILATEYDEAEGVLDDAPDQSAQFVRFARGLLHFRTARWPDVLTALRGASQWDDAPVRATAEFMLGSACAHLGLFGEAERLLSSAESGPLPDLSTVATYTRGLNARESGDEARARTMFETVYVRDPDFADNAKALNNTGFRLFTTSKEEIASRTDRWDPSSIPQAASVGAVNEELLERARRELDRQVGQAEVKDEVDKIRSGAQLARIRAGRGLSSTVRSHHLAFTGPPGTGKTTIARIVAQIYCGVGILKTDRVVECSRRDLVGSHLGSTAPRTSAVIDRALDGVLFIDEAYSLIQTGLSGGDAFGREAIDTLIARMEDDRDRLVVIIAGYDGEIDRLLASNDGLASRFSRRIRFPSYTPAELGAIGDVIAERRDSVLSPQAQAALVEHTARLCETSSTSDSERRLIDVAGNGRFVRNVIEAAEEEREHRLAGGDTPPGDLDSDALMRIERTDLDVGVRRVLSTITR
ncbi:type VII secretion AAA-ATPase EccA [Williamsia sp.]|uniref:type VII secretion AAA-ATPase EccA n=1 Tax=Williamsia sp. TaxID=1872085 RepID=UPI001A237078|nr:type VII secretion AAA-ATPase EccA [Williamsia sp.]MBJ7291233.1 type VII secretion AAA-ATPase EccA [Williamsia sp.]